MHSPRMGSIGCIFCIQDVVKMQNKEFEKQCFQYTLLTFVSSIQILIYSQCPISRICPDTINIEQGHTILEYLPFWLLKNLDKYNSYINMTFWQFNLLLTYMFKISFLWKSEFICFRTCTDLFLFTKFKWWRQVWQFKFKIPYYSVLFTKYSFFVLEMYCIFYSMDQWE